MNLGDSLSKARRKSGLSQEAVAEKLGISRQTVSKWETGETLPDIRQSKELALLYRLTLDELISFDVEVKELEETVRSTSEEVQKKVDWNRLWAEKYPVLARYQGEVETGDYEAGLGRLLEKLKEDYRYSDLDAFLVLKDILGKMWNNR